MSGFHQSEPASGQPRPVACYNCGSWDHMFVVCPEAPRDPPSGLVKARALEAAKAARSSSDNMNNAYRGTDNRPFKRQKTGPVVTRYPAPSSGPVVTRYAPPPYAVQGHGVQTAPPHPQTPAYQPQHYGPPAPQQPNLAYQPYGQQHPSYGHPWPGAPQYGPPPPVVPQGFGPPQMYGQAAPQAAYPQYDPYNSGSLPQQYGYTDPQQHSQQSMIGQSQQVYPPYQGSPQSHMYSHSPQAPQQTSQQWGYQPTAAAQYSASSYQSSYQHYEQPHSGQYQTPPQRAPYQTPQYGAPSYPPHVPSPSLTQTSPHNMVPNGYGSPATPQESRLTSEQSGESGIGNGPYDRQSSLDVPTSPDTESEEERFDWDYSNIFLEQSCRPANEISCPLPSAFDEESILPRAPNATGIICKYVRANNLEVFCRPIRQSLHWALLKTDPVFSDINYTSRLIPLEEVGAWAAERQNQTVHYLTTESTYEQVQSSPSERAWCNENDDRETPKVNEITLDSPSDRVQDSEVKSSSWVAGNGEAIGPDRSSTSPFELSSTPTNARSGTPVLEAGDDDVWAPQPGESQIVTPSATTSTDPTEALLASLGVTGPPKPVSQRPPSFSASGGNQSEMKTDTRARQPLRQDSGYASARGSYSSGSVKTFDHGSQLSTRQVYNETQPPPPPPPLTKRKFDGHVENFHSDGSVYGQTGGRYDPYDGQSAGRQGSSPLTPTSAELIGHERRIFEEHLNAKKTEPQRQVDDVTPKMKRRQPKVADAYSRRW